MTVTAFADRLDAAIEAKGSPVCAGIDPQLELFPPPLQHLASLGASLADAPVVG